MTTRRKRKTRDASPQFIESSKKNWFIGRVINARNTVDLISDTAIQPTSRKLILALLDDTIETLRKQNSCPSKPL